MLETGLGQRMLQAFILRAQASLQTSGVFELQPKDADGCRRIQIECPGVEADDIVWTELSNGVKAADFWQGPPPQECCSVDRLTFCQPQNICSSRHGSNLAKSSYCQNAEMFVACLFLPRVYVEVPPQGHGLPAESNNLAPAGPETPLCCL